MVVVSTYPEQAVEIWMIEEVEIKPYIFLMCKSFLGINKC